jgi:transcription antitermination factor NusG
MVYSSFIVLWTPNVLNVWYIPQTFIQSSISSLQYSQRYNGSEASHQTTPVIPNGFIISWGFPNCLWVSLGHLAASCLFSMWSLFALQILLPSVPRRKVLKDGRYSDARQRLYPGCLLVQCVLNREVYNFIRSVPGVWDFFGTRANTRSVYTF